MQRMPVFFFVVAALRKRGNAGSGAPRRVHHACACGCRCSVHELSSRRVAVAATASTAASDAGIKEALRQELSRLERESRQLEKKIAQIKATLALY